MAWQGFSKRKFPRIDCNFDVTVMFADDSKEKSPAIAKNIGIGGICVVINKKLQLFDMVNLEMKLPITKIKEPVSCNAKVVWVIATVNALGQKVFDVGLEFMGLKRKDKDKIECIVERCNPYG